MTGAPANLAFPLDVAPDPDAPVELYTLVVDANGEVVADCGILGRSHDENEATARFLVNVVQDALDVAHLQEIRRAMNARPERGTP